MMLVAVLSAWLWVAGPEREDSGSVAPASTLVSRGPVSARPVQTPPDRRTDHWLGEDKLKHFFMSYAVTAMSFGGARAAGIDVGAAIPLAAATGIVAGLGKEVSDRARGGPFGVRDLAWDALGIGAAIAIVSGVR